jgi:hypothetical protein
MFSQAAFTYVGLAMYTEPPQLMTLVQALAVPVQLSSPDVPSTEQLAAKCPAPAAVPAVTKMRALRTLELFWRYMRRLGLDARRICPPAGGITRVVPALFAEVLT